MPVPDDLTQRERDGSPEGWGPPRWRTVAYAGLAVLAAGLALTSAGGPVGLDGGVAFTVLAAVAAGAALADLWWGVVLVAEDDGIGVRTAGRRWRFHPWQAVVRIEPRTTVRGVLRLASLELDVADVVEGADAAEGGEDGRERLILLSRHRLGADPEKVAERLRQRRQAAGRPGGGPRREPR